MELVLQASLDDLFCERVVTYFLSATRQYMDDEIEAMAREAVADVLADTDRRILEDLRYLSGLN